MENSIRYENNRPEVSTSSRRKFLMAVAAVITAAAGTTFAEDAVAVLAPLAIEAPIAVMDSILQYE